MRADCGITGPDPWNDDRFNAVYQGWGCQLPLAVERELMILIHTPGIPVEWVHGAFALPQESRRSLRRLVDMIDAAEFEELGKTNAETLVEGDGWRMLTVLRGYKGPVPFWSQLELKARAMTAAELAAALGCTAWQANQWRSTVRFDPVTLERKFG